MRHRLLKSSVPGAIALTVTISHFVGKGDLNPPVGPVAPAHKTWTEVEPRIAINATNTPGDADSLFRIAETNATNVFIVEQGAVRTSRPIACPEGITRATVLGLCRQHRILHEETGLSLMELYRTEECSCSGTMGELAPVSKVDGLTIGDGGPDSKRIYWSVDEYTRSPARDIAGSFHRRSRRIERIHRSLAQLAQNRCYLDRAITAQGCVRPLK